MKIIKGDLIELAKQGHFEDITHGCNCQNNQQENIFFKPYMEIYYK
jgi:hypothetical protein